VREGVPLGGGSRGLIFLGAFPGSFCKKTSWFLERHQTRKILGEGGGIVGDREGMVSKAWSPLLGTTFLFTLFLEGGRTPHLRGGAFRGRRGGTFFQRIAERKLNYSLGRVEKEGFSKKKKNFL